MGYFHVLSGIFEMLKEHLPSSPSQFWVTAVCCIRRVGHCFCVVPTEGDSNNGDGGRRGNELHYTGKTTQYLWKLIQFLALGH